MDQDQVGALLSELLEQNAPVRFSLPVSLEQIDSVSIRITPDDKAFLSFTLVDTTPQDVSSIMECVRVDAATFNEPTDSTVIVRPWLSGEFYLNLMFGDNAPEFILFRCTPLAGDTREGIIAEATVGTVTSTLELAFLTSDGGSLVRYLDPAIIIRVLALFSEPYEQILLQAIGENPSDSFGLNRFCDYHDALVEPIYLKLLCKEVLRFEMEGRIALSIPTDTAPYTDRLPIPSSSTVTRATLVSDFHLAVESGPDKFAYFQITDMNLHLAVFRADRYQMDLIDIRSGDVRFSNLVLGNSTYKIIVNGPVFDLSFCGKAPDPVRLLEYLLAMQSAISRVGFHYPGLTKGTLVFRGRSDEQSDCPIPSDPQTWRYHFGQTIAGEFQLKLFPIQANHNFACAVEPVIGVFRNGQRIGIGHEIDTDRQEPDIPYAGKPGKAGIPIIGRCQKTLIEYLFVLIRPDFYFDQPTMSSWEDMIDLLRDIGVIDAFITDGDDSVGLIVENSLFFQPGLKKDAPMPLAIGFRKV